MSNARPAYRRDRTRNRRIMKRSLRHSIFLVQHSALYNRIFETRRLHCPLCQVSTVQPLKGGQGGIFTGSPKVSRFGGIPERCPSWPKERDWKSRVPLKKWYRGFESLSLRQQVSTHTLPSLLKLVFIQTRHQGFFWSAVKQVLLKPATYISPMSDVSTI